jgi:hypothetical protein
MRPIHLLSCLLSIYFISAAQNSIAASRVFHDDFESGNTSKWQFPGSYDRAIVVSTAYDGGRPRGGSRMLEGNWNGTIDYTDPRKNSYATLLDWNYTNEFLIRFWIRLDRDVDRKNGTKLLRLGTIGVNMFYIGATLHEVPGLMVPYFESVAGSSGPITYNGGVIGDNNWHKVEIYVKHNTPGQTDGILRMWTDGVRVLNGVNIRSVSDGGNWKPMNLMSNWSNNPGWEHDANNHAYWDDIEIFSDANTGTAMTGRMDDATAQSGGGGGNPPQAPRPPTNLRLIP